MLKLEDVTKIYNHRRKQVKGLDNLTLEIPKGDFVAIVGPSGSGKSTLLLTLGGMLSPTSGRVYLEENSIYDLSTEDRARIRRNKIGFVFQTFNLVPFLTALENVQIPLLLSGLEESDQRQRAVQLLEQVGLADRLDHKPNELSVGQQQRVALARMLANDPDIVLADEPTGNLDPETCEEMIGFLERLNDQGKTVVIVTHDPEVAERARRRLRFVSGRVVQEERKAVHVA